jgi:NAD-dependent dihydropyrimidine dehydrogenase PreA subunit
MNEKEEDSMSVENRLYMTARMLMSKFPGSNLAELEHQVTEAPGAHCWTEDSPIRFDIMKETKERGKGGPSGARSIEIMAPTTLDVLKSLRSLNRNPRRPKTEAPPALVEELKEYLLGLGASSVGYTRVPEHWIFQHQAILHTNAIVLTMEMDKRRIDTVPSEEGQEVVLETYHNLGHIVNKGADFLRKRGYSAQAGHPLGGQALYPPLAQMAGLGWLGAIGLIITPEHGPRVRLAAIYTSIENLPFSTGNEHQWVEDYCAVCHVCVHKCPVEAIMSQPQRHENGQITYVINERCFPHFSDYYGCSVCIAVCPFNNAPYEKLKQHFVHSGA